LALQGNEPELARLIGRWAVGEKTLEGEYVVVTQETEDGKRIGRLIGFPPRRTVDGAL
jgi:hypothetical protein